MVVDDVRNKVVVVGEEDHIPILVEAVEEGDNPMVLVAEEEVVHSPIFLAEVVVEARSPTLEVVVHNDDKTFIK